MDKRDFLQSLFVCSMVWMSFDGRKYVYVMEMLAMAEF
jgi:hypothetical protein